MSDATVHDRLQGIFRAVFADPALQISDAMTADDVERWDSLTHITLIMDVEKAFGLRFRNSEVARLQNVGDLKALIAKHLPRP
jgi:acyl carrier protein